MNFLRKRNLRRIIENEKTLSLIENEFNLYRKIDYQKYKFVQIKPIQLLIKSKLLYLNEESLKQDAVIEYLKNKIESVKSFIEEKDRLINIKYISISMQEQNN